MATEPRWCSISEAARVLKISERAVRKRIGAGRLDARRDVRGNRVRTLVQIEGTAPGAAPAEPGAAPVELVAELRATIARLEGEVAWLRGEVERRRWRGVRAWVRWLWTGE